MTPQAPLLERSLVWLRRDLRVDDHAALYHALQRSRQVVCVFVFDSRILAGLPADDRRVAFIHATISELQHELQQLGGNLVVLHGDAGDAIPQLAAQLGCDAVFCNHDYEPAAIQRDRLVAERLASFSCSFHSFKDQVIFERDEVLSLAGTPFSVFTPYKNAWLKKFHAESSDFYARAYPVRQYLNSLVCLGDTTLPTLEQLGFGAAAQAACKLPSGSSGARQLLSDFLERIDLYQQQRDYPAIKGPSYLSVHLRFGSISIRQLVREALRFIRTRPGSGAETWLSELIWRDFYFMILSHHPRVVNAAFKPEYDAIVWETGPHADQLFAAWCEGRTGYPLVDAAMHQLNQSGYMHNRLRMVVASFLCKDLGIDWRRGEAYFAEKLIDFDLSANNGGWQWASSSGCDAQPYFRIFNPVTQSEKFDPQGKFILRYLPQLAKLDARRLHAPWTADPAVLRQAGLQLGLDYPFPVVAHDEARKQTLARYGVVKKSTPPSDQESGTEVDS